MRCSLLCFVIVLALSGCGDTTIAFCSGGDDHCDNFFLKIGGEEEDEDPDPGDGEETEPDENAQATADEPLQAALKLSRLTPREVATAIALGGMDSLTANRPDLVGLWLIQASLARLWDSNDNVAATEFLDRNRAWLSAGSDENRPVAGPLLASGLRLFAAFSSDLDPISAGAARLRADPNGPDSAPPGDSPQAFVERAGALVIRAAQAPSGCCSAAELAAAALVLCGAHERDGSGLKSSREPACGQSALWFESNVVHSAGY